MRPIRMLSATALAAPALAIALSAASAQTALRAEYLWPQGAPGALDKTEASKPSVVIHPPAAGKDNGAAVVICGGGGYTYISYDRESDPAAAWLNTLGVTAFVLHYRLAPAYRHPVEMQDAQRAMRWVRANAARYGIDAHRVGILGFSAGGHLASTVATHNDQGDPAAADTVDRHSCRPNFQILIYPVITMDTLNHGSSRGNLLGPNPSAALLEFLSNEKHVTAATAPAFIVHGKDDATVPVKNSQLYDAALRGAGVASTLKLYDHGPHGFGLADGSGGAPVDPVLATWPGLAGTWMKTSGFLEAKPVGIEGSGFRRIASPVSPSLLPMRGRDGLGRRLPVDPWKRD
jgi:acetyl esterase/lipase